MRRVAFTLGAAGIVAGAAAGTVILSGIAVGYPLTGAMAYSSFTDTVTTDTTPGKIVIAGTGALSLALGTRILYEYRGLVEIIRRGCTFFGEHGNPVSLGRFIIENLSTKQLIPNNFSELTSFAGKSLGTTVVVSFTVFTLVTAGLCLYLGYDSLKKVSLSFTKKD